jgi:hypothetical protein
MAEEFLHCLDILTVGLEECRIGAPEGMPANPFDAELLGCWKDMRPVECAGPIGQSTIGMRAREDPILRQWIRTRETPVVESFRKPEIERHGLASVLQSPMRCMTMDRVTEIWDFSKSMSFHFNASSSPTRSPVSTSRKTAVCAGSLNKLSSAAISSIVSTIGIFARFALWRTCVIGFRSCHSHRIA